MNVLIDENTLKDIADSVRSASGTSEKMFMGSVSDKITEIANDKYQSGYNSGIEYADGRVNTDSTNYKTGYNAGVTATKKGTATAENVLAGKTFTNDSGVELDGAMKNYAGVSTPKVNSDHITNINNTSKSTETGHYFNAFSHKVGLNGYVTEDTEVSINIYGLHPDIIKAGALIGAGPNLNGVTDDMYTYGTYTSDATATADDILAGETAYVDGMEVTGTMPNNGAVSKTITPSTSSQSYTIPKGFHDGSGKVTVNAAPTSLIDGDATAENVLAGKTFFVDSYTKKTGTMTNNGAKTASLDCGESYTIPKGYHDGTGKVTANSLASQTDGTATASDILEGKTAYVDGVKLTGTAKEAPPNGKVWTQSNITSKSVTFTHYANGIWVACGDKGLHYSTDGMTWIESNITHDVAYVHYANGIWVAGSDGGKGLYYSTDGMTWIASNITDKAGKCICYANGIWVACGSNCGLYYSTDGMTWIASNIDVDYFAYVHYANGIWVAGSGSSSSKGLYYSTDGMTWTQSNIESNGFNFVHYANGIWVAGSGSGEGLYYSTDGMTWTQSNITERSVYCIYNANGIWVACFGVIGLYYSTDGMTWIESNMTVTSARHVHNANGIWVACTERGLYYSTDGIAWTQSNITNIYFVFAYNANGIWVACNRYYKGLYYSKSA